MYAIILGFITAFTLTYLIIPLIIRVAKERRIYDRPNERSSHIEPTPSLGGIGIFSGTICAIVLWTPLESFGVLQYILAAFVLIFLIGAMDDLMPMSPLQKLAGQVLVAIILCYKSNVKITSFYGVMGVYELPELTSFGLSLVIIVGIINAFNLIDGINGLAGSVALLSCLVWGPWFALVGAPALAVVAFSLAGAITAFLKYNFTPAKIFMGDTGSLLMGTVCSILALKFIEMNHGNDSAHTFGAAPAIAIAVLILPIYDTLRVFTMRVAQGRSPFSPDKRHIHHVLLQAGLSHSQATAVLVIINLTFIIVAFALNYYGTIAVLAVEIGLAMLLTFLLRWLDRRTNRRNPDQLAA
jgi:UDP-N-acetylmuramyl pentapeptide phosphotransferase/UDP-N-acetylglucosamine-1-phosphate transferase